MKLSPKYCFYMCIVFKPFINSRSERKAVLGVETPFEIQEKLEHCRPDLRIFKFFQNFP